MNQEALIKTEDTNYEKYLMATAKTIAVAGGGFLLIRFVVNRIKENFQQDKSFEEGNAATFAKQLKMAFDNNGWWGTDVPAVRRAFQEMPTKESFEAMRKSYQKMYHRNFIKDLTDELTNTEYNEMMSIVATKPSKKQAGKKAQQKIGLGITEKAVQWAKRLYAAISYTVASVPGTDEDAIRAVFLEIPSQAAYQITAAAYLKLYGSALEKDLKGDLEFWEYNDFISIIKRKPIR